MTALGLAVVVAAAAPIAWRYLHYPAPFFARTKAERDYRGFARDLAARLAAEEATTRHLVLVERNRHGHLGNPLLHFYLRAYDLEERIVLRGFSDPAGSVARLAAACARGCQGVQDHRLEAAVGAGSPFDQTPLMRQLIGLREPIGRWPATLDGVSLVLYSPIFAPDLVRGFRRRDYRGFVVLEPVASAPPPP